MRQKALFLDRDGVINAEHGFVGTLATFETMPGIFPLVRTARDLGYRVVVVTNQGGVALKLYTKEAFEILTVAMVGMFAREGVVLDGVFSSFEHPGTVTPTIRATGFWRKPKPGMIREAAQDLRLDLTRSIMIGDKLTDMQAALAAGVGTPLWLRAETDTPMLEGEEANPPPGVCVIHTLDEARKVVESVA